LVKTDLLAVGPWPRLGLGIISEPWPAKLARRRLMGPDIFKSLGLCRV